MIHILQFSTSVCRVVVILNVQRIQNKETKKLVELFCHWVTLQRVIHNQRTTQNDVTPKELCGTSLTPCNAS